jgi:hypothetical protein
MAETITLDVEVEGDIIMVTLPGTTFRVIYSKPKKSPGLSRSASVATRMPVCLRQAFSPAHGAWAMTRRESSGGLCSASASWCSQRWEAAKNADPHS